MGKFKILTHNNSKTLQQKYKAKNQSLLKWEVHKNDKIKHNQSMEQVNINCHIHDFLQAYLGEKNG